MFQNMGLRIIFAPKRDKVTGEWRGLHNEELYDLYNSSNIIQINVPHMGREEQCTENLMGKPKGKNYLENLDVDGEIILRSIFKRRIGGGMDWINLAQNRDRWWAFLNAVMNL